MRLSGQLLFSRACGVIGRFKVAKGVTVTHGLSSTVGLQKNPRMSESPVNEELGDAL